MLWIIMLIAMLLCLVGAGIYYNILLRRFLGLFLKEWKRWEKIAVVAVSVLLGILSANLFSTTGVILVHILAAALLVEAVHFLIRKCGRGSGKVWNAVYRCLAIPLLVTAVIFTYGYINIRQVTEKDYTITTDKEIPSPLRVLLLTDCHYGTIFEGKKLRELCAEWNTKEADIIVLGGDIVDESTTKEQMQEIFRELGAVKSTYGIYYAYGNHDRQSYRSDSQYTEEELTQAITESGIHILQDTCMEVTDGVVIAGREDYGKRDAKGRLPVSGILEKANREDYVIMVDHQPVEYDENAAQGVDLLLSGHTHDGQIFPVGYVMRLFQTSDQIYGIEKNDNMYAVVSAGAAGWGYPIRTQNHSEYTMIQINRA